MALGPSVAPDFPAPKSDWAKIGGLFATTKESSAHIDFKNKIIESKEGDNQLRLKNLTPVRLLKNPFYEKVKSAEDSGASVEELANLLGRGRAKQSMFEGNLEEGELEIGQVSAMINEIKSVTEVFDDLINEYNEALRMFKGVREFF